jgi:tRNA (guanine-N7-)-methyltransferase
MTDAQQRALEEYLPKLGLSIDQPWDFKSIFGRDAPTILEIGFGMGNSLFEMVANHPTENFIGIEVHRPGVGSLLSKIGAANITNFRVCIGDARLALENSVPDASLARVQLFFPDPWPKTRHHKRRLVQTEFMSLIAKKLRPDGIFHVATDWAPYAEHILEIMAVHPSFENVAGDAKFSERPDYRPITKYEMRGQRLGHDVFDMLFRKK